MESCRDHEAKDVNAPGKNEREIVTCLGFSMQRIHETGRVAAPTGRTGWMEAALVKVRIWLLEVRPCDSPGRWSAFHYSFS